MSAVSVAKGVLGFTASVGAGLIVGSIVNTHVTYSPGVLGKIKFVAVRVGAFALSGIVSTAAEKQIEKDVDELVDAVKGIKAATDEIKSAVEDSK